MILSFRVSIDQTSSSKNRRNLCLYCFIFQFFFCFFFSHLNFPVIWKRTLTPVPCSARRGSWCQHSNSTLGAREGVPAKPLRVAGVSEGHLKAALALLKRFLSSPRVASSPGPYLINKTGGTLPL